MVQEYDSCDYAFVFLATSQDLLQCQYNFLWTATKFIYSKQKAPISAYYNEVKATLETETTPRSNHNSSPRML